MSLMMRRNLMAGGDMPTARDYVQDGLVAMWDGIENAGFGIPHNPSASIWTDCKYGYRAELDANTSFVGGNHFRSNHGAARILDTVPFADVVSLEVVMRLESYLNNVNNIILQQRDVRGLDGRTTVPGISIRGGFPVLQFINGTGDVGIKIPSTPTDIFSVYVDYENYMAKTLLKNGGEVETGTGSSTWFYSDFSYPSIGGAYGRTDRSPVSDIYCLRFYNLALTAAEVSANYAIDKVRFGLT